MNASSFPRVLLVEDDPVSRAFMAIAVQGVPAEVDSADGIAAALSLASGQDYALWLLDAHLPDGTGVCLLEKLRIRHPLTPALAHTASGEKVVMDALIAAGFVEVLIKPLSATAVQAAVRRVLGLAPGNRKDQPSGEDAKLPAWDDAAAALALNGNRVHIQTLRGLFVAELPHLCELIIAASHAGDYAQARTLLHKLRASCGFVGAARLGAAVLALHRQAESGGMQARFQAAAQDTLAAGMADATAQSPAASG